MQGSEFSSRMPYSGSEERRTGGGQLAGSGSSKLALPRPG